MGSADADEAKLVVSAVTERASRFAVRVSGYEPSRCPGAASRAWDPGRARQGFGLVGRSPHRTPSRSAAPVRHARRSSSSAASSTSSPSIGSAPRSRASQAAPAKWWWTSASSRTSTPAGSGPSSGRAARWHSRGPRSSASPGVTGVPAACSISWRVTGSTFARPPSGRLLAQAPRRAEKAEAGAVCRLPAVPGVVRYGSGTAGAPLSRRAGASPQASVRNRAREPPPEVGGTRARFTVPRLLPHLLRTQDIHRE
jgi:hypothetical protein